MSRAKKTQASFEPLDDWLQDIRSGIPKEWSQVEQKFLDAVSRFDERYRQGRESSGWYQSKARYFNDGIMGLIENKSKKTLSSRIKCRSQMFDKIDIDVCYPSTGNPIAAAECKALGTPPHQGNDFKGRGSRADLHKRAREVAFTSADLKSVYAQPTQIYSLPQWLRAVQPGYFSFWAMRIQDERDRRGVAEILGGLKNYCDGVGAIFYRQREGSETIAYESCTPNDLAMDKAIRDMAQRIAAPG